MQATARMASVVSSALPARRRLIRTVRRHHAYGVISIHCRSVRVRRRGHRRLLALASSRAARAVLCAWLCHLTRHARLVAFRFCRPCCQCACGRGSVAILVHGAGCLFYLFWGSSSRWRRMWFCPASDERSYMPPLTPNKTDAGNGSYGICRVIDASPSPSPDPSRSPNQEAPGQRER
jgi:hypothetical protein